MFCSQDGSVASEVDVYFDPGMPSLKLAGWQGEWADGSV